MRRRPRAREPWDMPRYLVERSPGGLDLPAAQVAERSRDGGVTWLHSYVSEDRRRAFDVYDAPSPEAVRRTASRNRLPIDAITEVRVLEPYAYREKGAIT